MAFAYGQNMTELGRNIIDLEQLRNSRDAQQAQAQNQFLAQLNQAALGRQQIAAQAQAQQNAMMAQAIQQRQYQGNLDRDFGLRQNAQTNQAQQFQDALKVDMLRFGQPGKALEKAQFEEDSRIEEMDSIADSIAKEANRLLEAADNDRVKKRVAINSDKSLFATQGRANAARDSAKAKVEAEHELAVKSILDPYQKYVGYFNVANTQFKPGWTEGVDNPRTIRLVPVIRGKRKGQNVESPLLGVQSREVETGVGPLPITPSRTQPGRSSTPSPFIQPPQGNQIGGLLKSAGISSSVAAKAIQSGLVPVINAVGEIKMPKLSDLTDWIKNGWRIHPSAEGVLGGITNTPSNPLIDPTAQIQNAPANSYFDPVRSY